MHFASTIKNRTSPHTTKILIELTKPILDIYSSYKKTNIMTFNEVIKESISKNLRVEISYKNYDKENSIRQLGKIEYSNEFQKNNSSSYEYISAYCHLRNEKRTFKLNRIEKIRFVANSLNSNWVENPSLASSKKSNSSGCYIATMAYGDYEHPKVLILRNYRDEVLLHSFWGRLFVKLYYSISPKIVFVFKNQEAINNLFRNILDKFIKHLAKKQ